MSNPIGTAKVKVGRKTFKDVDVYSYKDYRTVFPSDLGMSKSEFEAGPQMIKVKYRGNMYTAKKYGNPNNQVPSYDFKLKS